MRELWTGAFPKISSGGNLWYQIWRRGDAQMPQTLGLPTIIYLAYLWKTGIYTGEIFMNDDSDEEFLGFGPDDVNNNQDLAAETDSDSDNETDPMDEFTANKWRLGDRVNRDNFVFTGNNGIEVDIPENPKPLDFIAIFLTDEFFETVTYQTNLYATSYLRSHRISPHSGPPTVVSGNGPRMEYPLRTWNVLFLCLFQWDYFTRKTFRIIGRKMMFFPFCYATRSFPEYTVIFMCSCHKIGKICQVSWWNMSHM